jgi:hypothetical protein
MAARSSRSEPRGEISPDQRHPTCGPKIDRDRRPLNSGQLLRKETREMLRR